MKASRSFTQCVRDAPRGKGTAAWTVYVSEYASAVGRLPCEEEGVMWAREREGETNAILLRGKSVAWGPRSESDDFCFRYSFEQKYQVSKILQ